MEEQTELELTHKQLENIIYQRFVNIFDIPANIRVLDKNIQAFADSKRVSFYIDDPFTKKLGEHSVSFREYYLPKIWLEAHTDIEIKELIKTTNDHSFVYYG